MKKAILALFVAALTIHFSYAQTNTFPSSGNVGVGITSPNQALSVNGNIEIAPSTAITKAYLFTSPSSNWGPVSSGLFLTPKDGIDATPDFAINLWDGDSSTPGWGTRPTRFFIDGASGNVGIGTSLPTQQLSITGNMLIQSSSATSKGYVFSSPSSNWGPQLSGLYFKPRDAVNATTDFSLNLWDGFTGVSTKVFVNGLNGNVGIGTITPDQALTVNGTAHAKEVLVDMLIYPDYVFKPTYHLPTLNEVKTYIDQNHHLPDMPTEAEIVKNGLKVGETEALLTKKVEELTLYLIDLKKENEALKQNQQAITKKLKQYHIN